MICRGLRSSPRLKRGRPPHTTKERQPAMIYVVEFGAEFAVTGAEEGLAAAALYAASGAHVRPSRAQQCLWNCLEGMGHGGHSAREIVETFRAYTAERVQVSGGRVTERARRVVSYLGRERFGDFEDGIGVGSGSADSPSQTHRVGVVGQRRGQRKNL